MKLTKTDHHEQALILDDKEKDIICDALDSMLCYECGSIQKLDIARRLKLFLESDDKQDHPALFQRSHGNMMNCPDCSGSGFEKYVPEDQTEDVEYPPCTTCKGTGQLYLEVIRKGYVPTQLHRKKLAK